MAHDTYQVKFEEILSKLTALQEKQELLIAKQSQSFEFLTNSVKELKIGFQSLEDKVEQYIHRPPHISSKQQLNSPTSPNLQQPWQLPIPDSTNPPKSMRLDVPRFSGENSSAWIPRIQRYFDFYNVSDSQRLKIAYFHLDGDALDWYDLMSRNQSIPNWKEFLFALEKRFGLSEFEGSFDELSEFFEEDRKGDMSIEANSQDSPSYGREEPEHTVAISAIDEINSSGWKYGAEQSLQTNADSRIPYICMTAIKYNWVREMEMKFPYINCGGLIHGWMHKYNGCKAPIPYGFSNSAWLQPTLVGEVMEVCGFPIRMGNLHLKAFVDYCGGRPNNKFGRRKRKAGPITLMMAMGMSNIFEEEIICEEFCCTSKKQGWTNSEFLSLILFLFTFRFSP